MCALQRSCIQHIPNQAIRFPQDDTETFWPQHMEMNDTPNRNQKTRLVVGNELPVCSPVSIAPQTLFIGRLDLLRHENQHFRTLLSIHLGDGVPESRKHR
ncbi:hypothetical protein M8818_004816 [Zalaria obscura]|uniref:Uncharacterized protein n=1 Tax=Zalaria obscura TaxID=2024903 RepID=A0ACC3SBH5_9PEZI